MGMTLAERILARAGGKNSVEPGDIIDAKVDLAMIHEMTAQVIDPFEEIGVGMVWNPSRVVIILDHWVPAPNETIAIMHRRIREFARKYSIKQFYDVGRGGIMHQVVAEEGFALPGQLVVGADSHSNTVGALGAFAVGIGATEMAAVLAQGKLWLKVPENMRIDVNGALDRRVVSKDVALKIIGELGVEGASYKAVEFSGSTIRRMNMSERLTLPNMTAEMGAKTGLIAPDEVTREYLGRKKGEYEDIGSDDDATFQEGHHFDVAALEPQVACPHIPSNVKDVGEVKGVKVDQAFLGSCTNGRIEDLRAAAEILKGEEIHPDARMIVAPASQRIYRQALEEGLIEIFLDARAMVSNSSCGPCFGGHLGVLAPGDICISSSNRNFPGRMGSTKAEVYLASPYTVAASALYGEITDPRGV